MRIIINRCLALFSLFLKFSMRSSLRILLVCLVGALALSAAGQDSTTNKSFRVSPPAMFRRIFPSGINVRIDYGQPSLKGRIIGKTIEPMKGKVWRAGANEATIFSTNRDLVINGQQLPAGRYALFMIADEPEWTVIFNKKADQWGAFNYNPAEDALRLKVKPQVTTEYAERLTYLISKTGRITMLWGNIDVSMTLE